MSIDSTTWAWDQISEKGLSPAQSLVFLAIARRAGPESEGICWPGARNIYQKCNLDDRYVRRIMRILERKFDLFQTINVTYENGIKTSNFYILNIPRDTPPSDLLKTLQRARSGVKFDEIFVLGGSKTQPVGKGQETRANRPTEPAPGPVNVKSPTEGGQGTLSRGSIDPGQETLSKGSVDPGQETLLKGSPDPLRSGSIDPLIRKSNLKGREGLIEIPSVPHGKRGRKSKLGDAKLLNLWGPVEGSLRKNIDAEVFEKWFSGIRLWDVTANEIVIAVAAETIEHYGETFLITRFKNEAFKTGLLRGRAVVVIPLEEIQ